VSAAELILLKPCPWHLVTSFELQFPHSKLFAIAIQNQQLRKITKLPFGFIALAEKDRKMHFTQKSSLEKSPIHSINGDNQTDA